MSDKAQEIYARLIGRIVAGHNWQVGDNASIIDFIERGDRYWRALQDAVESPIEAIMAAEFTMLPFQQDVPVWSRRLRPGCVIPVTFDLGEIVCGFKTDFCFTVSKSGKKLVVECDGHEFHSTKEQMQRDRLRDRTMNEHGVSVIRFTGAEIVRDSWACAVVVARHIMKMQPHSLYPLSGVM